MNGNRVVFSVYGTKPEYLRGVEANARLIPEVYPGWRMRVYCEPRMDTTVLEELGCEILVAPCSSRGHSGMFWRFLAAWDPELKRVLIRDADSRVNVREAVAVQAWVESGKAAHCLHDHPHHRHFPLQGGMWGVRVGSLPPELEAEVKRRCRLRQKRVMDMKFLRDHVYPHVEGSILRHSSVRVSWDSVPFPDHEPYDGFVGQQFDEEGRGIWPRRV